MPAPTAQEAPVRPATSSHHEAVTPPLSSSLITNPNWLSNPKSDHVGRLYLTPAMNEGEVGRAVLPCEMLTTGDVSNCSLVEENPKGCRFGEVAQAMTRYFRLNPRTVAGGSLAGLKIPTPIAFSPG